MTVQRRAKKFLSGEDFKIWRLSRGLTYAEVGRWLGVAYTTVMSYEESGITRTQALALAAIDACLDPWTPSDRDRAEAAAANDKERKGDG